MKNQRLKTAGLWLFLLCTLSNCRDFACVPLNQVAIPSPSGWRETAEPIYATPEPPVFMGFRPKKKESKLAVPHNYFLSRTESLSPGIDFVQYERKGNPAKHHLYTLRVVHIQPSQFSRLRVFFSDKRDQPLALDVITGRIDVMAAMNWVFFGRLPGGDIWGDRCSARGRWCKPGSYINAYRRVNKATHKRYAVVISRDNKPGLFRGGLNRHERSRYRLGMAGGILLFDKLEKTQVLYNAVGKAIYNRLYSHPRYNEVAIMQPGQAGDTQRAAPRSAVGILPDQSLVYINLSEGRFRLEGGATPYQMAVFMKQMGCTRAVMFDGGGAPVMVVKNQTGRLRVKTQPEMTATSNYKLNYSFLAIVQ